MLASLSTGHTIGLGVAAAIVIAFSLLSAFVLPRRDPDFPGRALPLYLIVVIVLFVGMLAAVEIFGAESEEGGHESPPAQAASP